MSSDKRHKTLVMKKSKVKNGEYPERLFLDLESDKSIYYLCSDESHYAYKLEYIRRDLVEELFKKLKERE